jgi:hypothetical protein
MMGFQGTPVRLFYDFCLDEHVPFDHMLSGIDRLALDDHCRHHSNLTVTMWLSGASLLPSNIKGSSLASPAMKGEGFPCRV